MRGIYLRTACILAIYTTANSMFCGFDYSVYQMSTTVNKGVATVHSYGIKARIPQHRFIEWFVCSAKKYAAECRAAKYRIEVFRQTTYAEIRGRFMDVDRQE